MTFGEKLKDLRKKRNLTIKELAEKSGVTAVSICNYENGHHKPNLVNIQKLSKALKCKYEDLYDAK